MSNFRRLQVDKRARDYSVFTTLDNHVMLPVTRLRSIVAPVEQFEIRVATDVAQRSWRLMARQFDPSLRRADL